jgi:glycosyltransferase involved in cell wall biosynthesis
MAIRLIHITPELPPTVGGVADYTALLSRRLVEQSDGAVEPVLVHAGWQSADEIGVDFPVVDLSGECSASALAETTRRLAEEANGRAVVLLEYSGYGYASRGAPLWLARGLRRVCGNGALPLVTMFHEISASGPIWSSAFWLSSVQRWIVKGLTRIAESAFVNRISGVQELENWFGAPSSVSVQPVFSNVGEPEDRRNITERERTAVLFAGRTEKERLYQSHGSRIRRLLRREELDRLIDIGPPPRELFEIEGEVEVLGVQPAAKISQLLCRARMGLTHRRLDLLIKSGVVAGYLAHGVAPVVVSNGGNARDSMLSAGEQYITLNRALSSSAEWEQISHHGYRWYQETAHSRSTARKVLQRIRSAISEKMPLS